MEGIDTDDYDRVPDQKSQHLSPHPPYDNSEIRGLFAQKRFVVLAHVLQELRPSRHAMKTELKTDEKQLNLTSAPSDFAPGEKIALYVLS